MIDAPPEISNLAAQVPSAEGVYFVSAFSGLLAPHWRDDARGTLVGLTLAHDKRHIARAVLEGIAFQVHVPLAAHDTHAPATPPPPSQPADAWRTRG